MNPERRAQILQVIESWVDDLDREEPLPDGFPQNEVEPLEQPDLLTVVTAMTGMTEEFRIQGKTFRKLQGELSDLRLTLSDDAARKSESHAEVPPRLGIQQESFGPPSRPNEMELESAREEGRMVVLREVIDIHDRLRRLHQDALKRRRSQSPLGRLLGRGKSEKALVEGLGMVLARFDDLLARDGVSRFGTPGEEFDPVAMKAVDAQEGTGLPSGRIIATVITGYRRYGKIIRTAQVQVAR